MISQDVLVANIFIDRFILLDETYHTCNNEMLLQLRKEMPDTRFRKVYTFNSARKSMSTIVPLEAGGFRVYTKGASEIIMKKCSFLVGKDGNIEAFNTQMQERLVQVRREHKYVGRNPVEAYSIGRSLVF